MIGFKIFLVVQVVCICLKIDGTVTWGWKEVFWVYWIFFSILVGITFGISLLFITKFCSIMHRNEGGFELVGLFWLLAISFGITCGSALLILGFLSYIEDKSDSLYFWTLCGLASFGFFMMVFTLIFWRTIYKFFMHVIGCSEEPKQENPNQSPEPNQEATDAQGQSIKSTKRANSQSKPLSIPMYLVSRSLLAIWKPPVLMVSGKQLRYSGTYFKTALKDEATAAMSKRVVKMHPYSERNSVHMIPKETKFQEIQTTNEFLPLNSSTIETMEKGHSPKEKPADMKAWHNLIMNNFTLISPHTSNSGSTLEQAESGREQTTSDGIKKKEGHGIDEEAIRNALEQLNAPRGGQPQRPSELPLSGGGIRQGVQSQRERRTLMESILERNESQESEKMTSKELIAKYKKARATGNQRFLSCQYEKPKEILNVSIMGSEKDKNSQNKEGHEAIGDIEASNICVICFEKPPDAVFMNCGHGGLCYDCSLDIWKATMECHLCRLVFSLLASFLEISLVFGAAHRTSPSNRLEQQKHEVLEGSVINADGEGGRQRKTPRSRSKRQQFCDSRGSEYAPNFGIN